ncbi:T9SS type A sorting domain-containing protein [Bacteroidota bacterium]
MKKLILLFCAVLLGFSVEARIRVVQMNNTAGTIKIKNVAGYAYNYANFQLTINGGTFNLSGLNIQNGADMNMDKDETISIAGLTIPSVANIAIWYPGSDPNVVTPNISDLVDFLAFGGLKSIHMALAISAGLWTSGEFISGKPPFKHDGSGEGASQWSDSSPVGVAESDDIPISVYPNPATDFIRLDVPSNQGSVLLTIVNVIGEVVESRQITGRQAVAVGDLKEGIYLLRLSKNQQPLKTIRVVKRN